MSAGIPVPRTHLLTYSLPLGLKAENSADVAPLQGGFLHASIDQLVMIMVEETGA